MAVHGALNFDVYKTICCNLVGEVVFVDDFLWDVLDVDAHVFEMVEFRVEVHVGYVHSHPFCTWSREDTVPVNFDGFHSGCFGGDFSWTVCD